MSSPNLPFYCVAWQAPHSARTRAAADRHWPHRPTRISCPMRRLRPAGPLTQCPSYARHLCWSPAAAAASPDLVVSGCRRPDQQVAVSSPLPTVPKTTARPATSGSWSMEGAAAVGASVSGTVSAGTRGYTSRCLLGSSRFHRRVGRSIILGDRRPHPFGWTR
jgi:hypothetical protein